MNYKDAKLSLDAAARRALIRHQKDRPAIRQEINNHAEFLCREIDHAASQGSYHRTEAEKYKEALQSRACNLHSVQFANILNKQR